MTKESTKERMLALLKNKQTPKMLSNSLGVGRAITHRHLKDLLDRGEICKFGRSPIVYYKIKEADAYIEDLTSKHGKELKDFAFQDIDGGLLFGKEAFLEWSKTSLKKISLKEKIEGYINARKILDSKRVNGFFDLSNRLNGLASINEKNQLESVVAIELRTIKSYGRTRMGLLLDVAKSSDSKKITEMVVNENFDIVRKYVKSLKIDACLFVPHTRKRPYQIMNLFMKEWIDTDAIKVSRVFSKIRREQKTIKRLEDRVASASSTFLIKPDKEYERVLLVDDFIGSGATINQIAKELKSLGVAKKVYALALVGEEGSYTVSKVS